MQRIPFTRKATDVEFGAIMQLASAFNDAEWRGFPPGSVQFNSADWDPATGILSGDLDVGRSRLLVDRETGEPTEHALYRQGNFALLGDVELGTPREIPLPQPKQDSSGIAESFVPSI